MRAYNWFAKCNDSGRMNTLITGAAGFIGSHLSETLLRKGHRVIGVDNFNPFYDPRLKRQNLETIKKTAKEEGSYFQCASGDICDADLVDTLLKEHAIECIIHLAAMAGVRPSIQDPLLYERVNGLGTYTLLEGARKAGVKNFIFGSSSSVYGLNKKVPFSESDPVDQPFSPYAQTKRANEQACLIYHELYGINFAILRFFTVYGPRQRPDLSIRKFTELLAQGKALPIYGDGSYKRDFTYIDDILDGITKGIEWIIRKSDRPKFEIFNLGESETTNVLDLVAIIERTMGTKAKREFHPAQPGDIPITYADISKSKKVLGYHPKTPIDEGIHQFVEWFKSTH